MKKASTIQTATLATDQEVSIRDCQLNLPLLKWGIKFPLVVFDGGSRQLRIAV